MAMAAAPEKKKKQKSEFEKACDELKEAPNDEKEQKEYETIRQTTALWPTHKNPNKSCAAGTRIIKPDHCSSKIREKLVAFIPNNCALNYCCFSKGDNCCPGFNMSAFQSIYSVSLAALFAVAVNCDQKSASSILKQVIGINQFDFSMTAQCCGTAQAFWLKMIGDAAFVKATGTSQRTDCITFAPLVAVKLVDDGLMVLKATKGLLGIGFCNLIEDPRRKTKRKKRIEGHSMIMIRNDNIENIEVVFYAKNCVTVNDFGISFKSNNLSKSGYDNPLVLCHQSGSGSEENVGLFAEQMPRYHVVSPVMSQHVVAQPAHYANSNGQMYAYQNGNINGLCSNTVISQPLGYPVMALPSMNYYASNDSNQANSAGAYSCVHPSYQAQRYRYSPY